MVLCSVEQDPMFSGGCNYLKYRTYYEVEIQYINYIEILPCFSDPRSMMTDVLY